MQYLANYTVSAIISVLNTNYQPGMTCCVLLSSLKTTISSIYLGNQGIYCQSFSFKVLKDLLQKEGLMSPWILNESYGANRSLSLNSQDKKVNQRVMF